jgi:hypothetical protein
MFRGVKIGLICNMCMDNLIYGAGGKKEFSFSVKVLSGDRPKNKLLGADFSEGGNYFGTVQI